MTVWIIEPRDPLIVRDGRPFGPTPGARAHSLDFPYPSTITGGVRTQAGQDENGFFDVGKIAAVKQVGIRGPLLVEWDEENKPAYLVPAPADALLLQENESRPVYRHRLHPLEKAGMLSDLADELYPVGMTQPTLSKPYKGTPRYWYWQAFTKWLTQPTDDKEEINVTELGHGGPGKEWRMHVKIQPETLTGEEGMLFATSGLAFRQRPSADDAALSSVKRLGLAAKVDNLTGLKISAGPAPLGGEQRVMYWSAGDVAWPTIPNGLADKIAQSGCCRLILLTPACFMAGWRPERLLQAQQGVTPELAAAVVGKAQTVSGWDFEKRGPKPARRLVPAGSVYFLRLGADKDAIKNWVEQVWLQNVSDTEEDRLSGFGLAAVGVWDGKAQTMEVSHG
jgi:CRISPR-associated protein Cmr3